MLLNAVIVPPTAVLVAVAHVVQSVTRVPAVAPRRRPGAHRRGGHPEGPPVGASDGVGHELDLIPSQNLSLPIAGFGNVTSADALSLANALKAAARSWASPTVHVAGGAALEFPDDRSVWAKLDGEIAALVTVANGVAQTVESRGFFVDRRTFRPWLAVATITDSTTAPHLEDVVAALDAFRGEPWTIDSVSLMKPSFDTALAEPRELYRIPLAPA